MPIDDALALVLRDALEYAKRSETSEQLEDVQEYGARARNTLESIRRNGLDPDTANRIETAIRHARNAEHATSTTGGRYDAGRAREALDRILQAAA